MKLGLQIPVFTWPGGDAGLADKLAEVARSADELGFASLWVMDHFFQIDFMGEASEPMLEGYSALSFLAAHTKRARLGTLVTGISYRHPGVLVKTATTLDVLSGGRGTLGIGAAWYEREHVGLGIPFPPLSERFEQLEDTLRLAKHMWSGDPGAPSRAHTCDATEPLCEPRPLSRPHPPIMIGGVGRAEDPAPRGPVRRRLERAGLHPRRSSSRASATCCATHCDAVDRDFDEIECSTLDTVKLGSVGGSPDEVVSLLEGRAAAGFSHAIVNLPNVHEIEPLEILAREVMPRVEGL